MKGNANEFPVISKSYQDTPQLLPGTSTASGSCVSNFPQNHKAFTLTLILH